MNRHLAGLWISVALFTLCLLDSAHVSSIQAQAIASATGGGWTTTTPLPEAFGHAPAVVYNGRVYLAGGEGPAGNIRTTVYYASFQPDGTLSTWTTTTPLPLPHNYHGMVAVNGYLYVFGGLNNSNAVDHAPINPDGTLGVWGPLPLTPLPVTLTSPTAVAAGGRIYVLGGYHGTANQNTVYYATVNVDGTLSNWNTTTPLPQPVSFSAAVVVNGRIYMAGGWTSASTWATATYNAVINNDGSLGNWNSLSALPKAIGNHVLLFNSNNLFVAGGWDGSTSQKNVYQARVQADGTLSTWTSATSLPQPLHDLAGASDQTNLYILGGFNQVANAYQKTVYLNQIAFSCNNVNEIPVSECQALVALYNSTGGASWTDHTNWLVTVTPCSWAGVTCSNNHVSKLSLSSNQLSGTLPTVLGNLTGLATLELPVNQLSGSIPSQLGTITSLTSINLYNNQLSGNLPTSLGSLTQLGSLELGKNQFSGAIPPELGNLGQLNFLDLSENQLTGNIPSQLGNWANLTTLYLNNNQLTGSLPVELGQLTKLEILNVSTNQLKGNLSTLLGGLTNLVELFVDHNAFSGPLPSNFVNLVHISTFHFDQTNLCEPADTTFQTWLASIADLRRTNMKCAALPVTLTSDLSVKTFLIPYGSGGSEPNGWTTSTFDDSTWSLAVIANGNSGWTTSIPGASRIWATASAGNGDIVLFRKTFTLPPNISYQTNGVDFVVDNLGDVYINSQLIGHSDGNWDQAAAHYFVDVSLLHAGTNVIAIRATNVYGGGCSGSCNPGQVQFSFAVDGSVPVNRPPVANGQNVTTVQNTPMNLTLSASDADGDPLTYIVVSNPSHGTLSNAAPNLTYTPNSGFSGTDSFTFKANDGKSDSNIATVSITVAPLPCYTLTTNVNPSVGGTVANTPSPNCQGNQYTQGTVVSLSAAANTGYAFSQWSGAASGNTNPVSVTMDGDKRVTANFTQSSSTSTVCGQVISGVSCTGGIGFGYPIFSPCDSTNLYLWQPNTLPADGFYRIHDATFAPLDSPLCIQNRGNITNKVANWSQYEAILSCNVCGTQSIVADFTASPLNGTVPLDVVFHNSSIGNITSCAWDYGDGQTGNLCNPDHHHTYATVGTYMVKLTVSGPEGSSTKTLDHYIDVSSSPSPIVLLPGIMGSKLENNPPSNCLLRQFFQGEVWPNIGSLLGLRGPIPSYSQYLGTLSLTDDGKNSANQCDKIMVSGILDQVSLADIDSYANFINTLKSAGYIIDAYPYDWRLDISQVADALNTYLNQTYPGTKVVLIGHSQGGLVARQYLHKFGSDHIKMVITVGTPYLGAPKAAYSMRSGTLATEYENWWDYIKPVEQDNRIRNDTLRLIVRNSPAANQLLPSRAYFQQNEPYLINGNSTLLNYDTTHDFLEQRGQNNGLIDDAQKWHDDIDGPLNVNLPYYILVGSHQPKTPTKVREFSSSILGYPIILRWDITYGVGDGTVPLASASLKGNAGDWSGKALCTFADLKYDHAELLRNPVIQTTIEEILQHVPLACPSSQVLAAQTNLSTFDFRRITVWGPAQVTITDSTGRVTGATPDGTVATAIPGSSYEMIGDGTFVTVIPTDTYTIKLKMTGDMPLEMRLENFSVLAEGDSTISQKTVFIDVPSAKGGAAQLIYNPAAPATSYQLKVDLDNNGTPDSSLPPDSVLTGVQVNDLASPITHIALSGKQDVWGFYTGPVTVNLDAIDDLSGIQRIEYSLDGGNTRRIYTGPFAIMAEDVPVLYVQATDRAGNAEFPWATAQLRPYHLYMPLISN